MILSAAFTVIVRCYSDLMKDRKKSRIAMLASVNQPSASSAARDVQQAGAICYRRNGSGQLSGLLVGSRRNGRWGVPKGHLDPGESSQAAAGRESFEEAGVVGAVDTRVFGSFSYQKDSSPHRYHVAVHLIQVSGLANEFPEKAVRKQRWFPLDVAVRGAAQPGLRTLLIQLRAADL
jgi:8-oxo-dGTP pyrophosphatase MutT (NUDIX family)